MKAFFFSLFISPFFLLHGLEIPDEGIDQFELMVAVPTVVFVKGLEIAKKHNFKFFKVLSYEYKNQSHEFHGFYDVSSKKGKYMEYKDENFKIAFAFFHKNPSDPFAIEVKKYKEFHELLEEVEAQNL